MISTVTLTPTSIDYLNRRELSQQEISEFGNLLQQVNNDTTLNKHSSKQILSQLTPEQLALLKKANSLADDINVASLSEEGATNLLRQPDFSDRVDLNNDGIVEVGIGKSLVFPPVNAPEYVKSAWQASTAGMSESDVMQLQLSMHISVFGLAIAGQQATDNPTPEQQWSPQGVADLFSHLWSGLDFAVSRDGWTTHNNMLRDFYSRFEQALSQSHNSFSSNAMPDADAHAEQQTTPPSAETPLSSQRMAELMQALLDAKMGLDRKKLEQIEQRIEAINANTQLDSQQKSQLLEQLEQLKQAVFKQAEQKLLEDEKRKMQLSQGSALLATLTENWLKSEGDKVHFPA